MSWKGKERLSLLEEEVRGSVYTVKKVIELEKHALKFLFSILSILQDLVLHKIFSALRGLINGHFSW